MSYISKFIRYKNHNIVIFVNLMIMHFWNKFWWKCVTHELRNSYPKFN